MRSARVATPLVAAVAITLGLAGTVAGGNGHGHGHGRATTTRRPAGRWPTRRA